MIRHKTSSNLVWFLLFSFFFDITERERLTKLEALFAMLSLRSTPIICLYLMMAVLAPRLMKMFKPLSLRRLLIVHNIICCLLSLYCVVGFCIGFWQAGGIFTTDRTNSALCNSFLVYWLSKLFELLDTVYMILRHKTRQISFLHVFHHASITLVGEWGYRDFCFPAFIPTVILNSAVHVVMYGYYGLTAFYPLKDFGWKKRITQMQIAQFGLALCHATYGYLYYRFCVYSILYGLSMVVLFSNFYYHAFIRKIARRNTREKKLE